MLLMRLLLQLERTKACFARAALWHVVRPRPRMNGTWWRDHPARGHQIWTFADVTQSDAPPVRHNRKYR
eukprot:4595203-Alexandrium_andersonii.AAC.1